MNTIKILLEIGRRLLVIALLTLLTQVGGLIYLLYIPLSLQLNKRIQPRFKRFMAKLGSFLTVYLLFSFLIIPTLASKISNRVPLPLFDHHVKPLHYGYVLLNRHYVKPQLKQIVLNVGERMDKAFPESIIAYMDAGFPFWNGYPLLPHLSHDDGEKIDIAFFFKDKEGKEINRKTPTFLGYGSGFEPQKGERDRPAECAKQGAWQYNWMHNNLPRFPWRDYELDKARSKKMIQLFARNKAIEKILIEPHMEQRLGMTQYGKLRMVGCKAVRHDDHIHVQL
ncbi:MAG: hypothetical protein AAFY71_00075 [Bacteroidota bacterium]